MAQQATADEPDVTTADSRTSNDAAEVLAHAADRAEVDTHNEGVWVTFHAYPSDVPAVVEAAVNYSGVTIHKVERTDGFVSVVVDKFTEWV